MRRFVYMSHKMKDRLKSCCSPEKNSAELTKMKFKKKTVLWRTSGLRQRKMK